jgi:hypothetical protein
MHSAVALPKLHGPALLPPFGRADCMFVAFGLELVRPLDMASAIEEKQAIIQHTQPPG